MKADCFEMAVVGALLLLTRHRNLRLIFFQLSPHDPFCPSVFAISSRLSAARLLMFAACVRSSY